MRKWIVSAIVAFVAMTAPAYADSVCSATSNGQSLAYAGALDNGILALLCDAKGYLDVDVKTSFAFPYTGAVGTQTPPAVGTSFLGVGGFDGTYFEPLSVTSSGALNVSGSLTPSGSFVMAGSNSTIAQDSYTNGPVTVSTGGNTTKTCSAATSCSVKSGAGRIANILITTVGSTGTITCYDATSATGTVIGGVSAANGALLFYEAALNNPAATGIYCVSAASGPAYTVSYY